MGGDDLRALAANLAAVEVEIDGALGEQPFQRARRFRALFRRLRLADAGAVRTVSAKSSPRRRIRLLRLSCRRPPAQRTPPSSTTAQAIYALTSLPDYRAANAAARFLSHTRGIASRRRTSRPRDVIARTDPTPARAPGPDPTSSVGPSARRRTRSRARRGPPPARIDEHGAVRREARRLVLPAFRQHALRAARRSCTRDAVIAAIERHHRELRAVRAHAWARVVGAAEGDALRPVARAARRCGRSAARRRGPR